MQLLRTVSLMTQGSIQRLIRLPLSNLNSARKPTHSQSLEMIIYGLLRPKPKFLEVWQVPQTETSFLKGVSDQTPMCEMIEESKRKGEEETNKKKKNKMKRLIFLCYFEES